MSADILPGFLLPFFRPLISELAERNSTISGHMVGSKCNLKTHVQNLRYPSPYKSGPQKPPFWTTPQLNGNFNGLYLQNKTRYRPYICGQMRCKPQGVSYIVSKQHELRSTNGFKLEVSFYSPSVNCTFHFICQSSQTEISKRNSTKLSQTVGANRANNPP